MSIIVTKLLFPSPLSTSPAVRLPSNKYSASLPVRWHRLLRLHTVIWDVYWCVLFFVVIINNLSPSQLYFRLRRFSIRRYWYYSGAGSASFLASKLIHLVLLPYGYFYPNRSNISGRVDMGVCTWLDTHGITRHGELYHSIEIITL